MKKYLIPLALGALCQDVNHLVWDRGDDPSNITGVVVLAGDSPGTVQSPIATVAGAPTGYDLTRAAIVQALGTAPAAYLAVQNENGAGRSELSNVVTCALNITATDTATPTPTATKSLASPTPTRKATSTPLPTWTPRPLTTGAPTPTATKSPTVVPTSAQSGTPTPRPTYDLQCLKDFCRSLLAE